MSHATSSQHLAMLLPCEEAGRVSPGAEDGGDDEAELRAELRALEQVKARCRAVAAENGALANKRWLAANGVSKTLQGKLTSIERRNKELETAAARLFGELEQMREQPEQLEVRLSGAESALASINSALVALEVDRDAEVAELEAALEDCRSETRRLWQQCATERREAAELVTELAAGEAASAELHAKKLEEIEGLRLALRDSEDARRQLEAGRAAEREEQAGLHAGSLSEIERLRSQLARSHEERQMLVAGELAELSDAKAKVAQLSAERQQLLSLRSLERDQHEQRLTQLEAQRVAEVSELESKLEESEAERRKLTALCTSNRGRRAEEATMSLRAQQAEDAHVLASQAATIRRLQEQLANQQAQAATEKDVAVRRLKAKASQIIRQNGAERREVEAEVRQLRADLAAATA